MILEIAGIIKIEDPDVEVVAEKLHELYAGMNDQFIILVKSDKDNDYMQAAIDEQCLFLVEYREGMKRKHYRIEGLGIEATLMLFEDYLRDGTTWKQCGDWQDISCTFCWDARQLRATTPSGLPLAKVVELGEVLDERRVDGGGDSGDEGLSLGPQSIEPLMPGDTTSPAVTGVSFSQKAIVYLLKAGPYYKIGKARCLDQRIKQIKLQLPYPVETLHSIETDDSTGIESYWHKRFACKRANGELD